MKEDCVLHCMEHIKKLPLLRGHIQSERNLHYLFKVVFFYVIIMRVEKNNIKKRILLTIFMCLCMLMGGCGNKQIIITTGFWEDEIFRVEDSHCVKAEVMVYLYNLHEQYERSFGNGIWNAGGAEVDLKKNLKQTVLARLAKIKLMNIMAGRFQVALGDADKAKAQQAAGMYYSSLSPAELELMNGITEEKLEKMYEEYAVADLLYDKLTESVDTEISDDEARVVRLHQIALLWEKLGDDGVIVRSTEEELNDKAAEIMEHLEAGEDFDTLAYTYNDAAAISVEMVKGVEAPGVENLCFALAEGEVGGPVKGDDGIYIFKCISTYDRQQTDERKVKLANERKKESFDSRYEEFAAGEEIYLNEDLWQSIELEEISDKGNTDFFEIYERFFGK